MPGDNPQERKIHQFDEKEINPMTSQKKFRWTSLLILVLILLAGAWYKRLQVASASSAKIANESAFASTVMSPMDADDLLVLRFDNSLNGENGETPTTSTGTSFQTGVSNQGVLLPNPNQLFYASDGNINATEGSFECWLKPTWNGNDGQGHIILQYGAGGGILIGKDGANNMRIILNRFGAAPGGEVGVAFNVGSWVANQWHHIAFTWSNTSKQLAVYIDGTLRGQNSFTINLPAISSSTIQIGGDGAGSYIQSVVDNLRISNVARTAQEISNRMLEGLTVSTWSLNPAATAVELWPAWYWWVTPTITASTNVGTLSLPVSAASWASSNASAAIFETSSGRFKALTPGSAVLTGTLGSAQNSFTINVVSPVLSPVEETIEPFMATPANGYLYRVPVVIIRYFPTRDGVNLDPVATGTTSTLAALKANVEQIERRHKFMLEEGSRFRGYGNAAAQPALGYQIIKTITVYEEVPPGFDAGGGAYFPDYNQILSRFGGENFVNNLGVKEFWIVQQHHGRVGINESNMSSPTTGDISNSFRTNGDQPIYNKTYVTYGINFTRSQAEATHNHGHQLESILSHVNQLRDGNTTLWWQQFARAANNPPARCGNTHFPPNATQDYDYTNLNLVASDILNWQPSGGPTTMVNANTWGNVPYAWPGGTAPPQEVESKWYIFWMQSMAGRGNTIPYNSNRLTNWWQFTGDWDAAIQGGLGLYEPGSCSYALSATSQTVPLGGGTFTVNVTGGAGCKWIASSNEPWTTVTGGSFGNGNGTVTVTVAAAGASRSGTLAIANQLFTINQTGGGCPMITVNPMNPTLPPSGTGQAYNQTFSATGGTGAYTFSVVAGALPAGLSFNPFTGVVSGTMGALGTYNFTMRATDENGCFGERAYTLAVTSTCPSITINPNSGSVPGGAVGTPYSLTFSASGGAAPYSYSVLVGILPLGLTLNATTGTLTGTPTGGGSYSFTARALDANNCTGARVYTIVISGACGFAINPTNASFPAQDGGDFVNVTTATGCAWTASSNNAWITIDFGASGNGLGQVAYLVAANPGPPRTGTMTIAGQTFTVSQSGGCPTISINPANATLPAGSLGTAYSQTFSQTGGAGAANFTISAGVLPTGLALNPSTGVLAGTPAAAGAFSFTVRATDANNCAGERSYTLSVTAGNCVAVSISNALTVTQDGNLTVPVTVGDLTGRGVVAYDFTVMFDPAVLQPSIPVFDQAGTLSSGMTVTQNTSVAGRVTISAFGTTALSGAGTLLNLKLKAVGAIALCSDLAWVGFTFNEGMPCAAVSNGRACVVGGTISGAVSYCLNQARKVPGVAVTASTSQSSTTNSAGAYSLTGLSGGAVTVTPTKTGDVNGISSFDASLAAQRAAGIISFTSCQESAADASNNSAVSSFDASLIAQYAAGISNTGSIAGTWKFAPPNRFYPSVTGDLTGENYDAVLVGDVSGNWAAPGNSPLPAAVQVPVSLPNASGLNGGSVTVPIMVGSLTGRGFMSYDFDLTFDQNVLQLQNPPIDASGTLSSGMTITPNPTPGRLRISAFGVSPLAGIGTLLALKFNVVGAAGTTTALNWQSFTFNEKIQTGLTNGSVAVCAAINLTPTDLPAGTQGLPYDQTLTASGGTAPYSFSVSAGTLPGNLSLSSAGILSGTPAAGAFNFTVRATDANGCFGEREYLLTINPASGSSGLQFYPLAHPIRLLETRNVPGFPGCYKPNAKIAGGVGGVRTQPAHGVCDGLTIPANAAAITGNITTVESGGGYLTLYPSDAQQPTVANSNYLPNEIVNNVFTVGLGANDGAFKIFVTSDTDVVIEVTGYYAPPAANGLYFHPLPKPIRLLETRPGQVGCNTPGAPLPAGVDTLQQGRLTCDGVTIPPTAQAIVGNATVVFPSSGGYLTLFPANAARPLVASSNYAVDQIVNGPFTVRLSPAGEFNIFTFAATHLVVDVLGYYSAEALDVNGAGLLFTPLPSPVRLLETRPGQLGCYTTNSPLEGGSIRTQQARGLCQGVTIAETALGIVGNATAVLPATGSYLTFWPSNAAQPLVANSNFSAGQIWNRHFTVGLGPDGAFKLFSPFTTELVIDVSGYFAP